MICPTCLMNTRAPRPRWVALAFMLGVILGHLTGPTVAHAAESYGSQLERIARAAESIARTLEKAAR